MLWMNVNVNSVFTFYSFPVFLVSYFPLSALTTIHFSIKTKNQNTLKYLFPSYFILGNREKNRIWKLATGHKFLCFSFIRVFKIIQTYPMHRNFLMEDNISLSNITVIEIISLNFRGSWNFPSLILLFMVSEFIRDSST